jgi:alpha-glucosidase
MQSVIQCTSQAPDPVLELHIYKSDTPSSFVYYEDDGTTFAYEQGKFFKRVINYDPGSSTLTLEPAEGNYTSKFNAVRVILHEHRKQSAPVNSGFGKNKTEIRL